MEKLFDVRCRFVTDAPVLHPQPYCRDPPLSHRPGSGDQRHQTWPGQNVEIRLSDEPASGIVLDGQGQWRRLFETTRVRQGMGLRIMRYRASLIGARVLLSTEQPSGGMASLCFLPKSQRQPHKK